MISSVPIEDHSASDQDMTSQDVDRPDSDQLSSSALTIGSGYGTQLRIGHLQSCAPNDPIVDRLIAKLFSRSRNIEWLIAYNCAHRFQYRKVSAPWRKNCPACCVIADATKFFWRDERLDARSYGWSCHGLSDEHLFNPQHPADHEHLQFFTKPGQ